MLIDFLLIFINISAIICLIKGIRWFFIGKTEMEDLTEEQRIYINNLHNKIGKGKEVEEFHKNLKKRGLLLIILFIVIVVLELVLFQYIYNMF